VGTGRTSSLGREWERRTRTTTGTLDTIQRRAPMLVPGQSKVAPQLWGHKLMRLVCGPIAHAILLGKALLAGPRRPWAAAFLAIHAVGIQAFVRQRQGGRPTAPERAIGQSLFLQATALGGIARYVRGERPALWQKPDRTDSAVGREPPR